LQFEDLNLCPEVLKALGDLGYITPTEIQASAIPILLNENSDFIGQAQTGTGKTASYVLPLLEKIIPYSNDIQALILTPTRELANQIQGEISKLAKYLPVKSAAIYGGASYDKQIKDIRRKNCNIVVGTPGRVMDMMEQGHLNFEYTGFVVLDEADEMLNMGFFDDVQTILTKVGDERKIWMFSATMPRPILNLINREFKDPKHVSIAKKTLSNESIEQRYYLVKQRSHPEALLRLIGSEPDMYGIVFCRTKKDTQDLANELLLKGYNVEVLHGDMNQASRDQAMARFKAQRSRLLICTDVAARGIDVNNLTHVINYGPPQDMESYLHRIGRTGRAGQKGIAISLFDPRDAGKIHSLERFVKTKIDHCRLPDAREMKKILINREVEALTPILNAVKEMGENFKVDETFEIFNEKLHSFSKIELMKILFTWNFNKELRRLNESSAIEEVPYRRNFDTRGGGNRSDRSSGGRRDSGHRRSGPNREREPARGGGGSNQSRGGGHGHSKRDVNKGSKARGGISQ